MLTNDVSRSISLSEHDFFEWAIDKLPVLDEIIITSHTPIMFFEEEQRGNAKEYLIALRERFESGNLNTKYYMSYEELNKRIIQDPTFFGRVVLMRNWQYKWENKSNISVKVASKGYFPIVSFWIGKQEKETQFTLIKLVFEDNEKMPPMWLRMIGEISGVEDMLRKLNDHSIPFSTYIQKYVNHIDGLDIM